MNYKAYIRVRMDKNFKRIVSIITNSKVATICEESFCPNILECWSRGSATFMVLGDICTRNCLFCSVKKGNPRPPDPLEPYRIAKAIKELGLRYVTITTVTRDDLNDGGARHIAKVIERIKDLNPGIIIEVLIPDFKGDLNSLKLVLDAHPHVVSHNVEVVERLTPLIRDRRASYKQSLYILKKIKELQPNIVTKSSLILGLGENFDEVVKTMRDLRNVNCDILVLSQYFRPTTKQVPVARIVPLDEFKKLESIAYKMGFKAVVAHPLARTSYRAEWAYNQVMGGKRYGYSGER
ncbi:MAG: lipoyl synthase [Thermoprotei archaeon]|nr:MAG: lipoyl synthase [Thermoprotei archaeon]